MTHEELLKKAKQARSAEELLRMAQENGIEMDEQSAAAYFAQMNKTGELADDELDSVAGGGCHSGGRLVVTTFAHCDLWTCDKCGGTHLGEDLLGKKGHWCDENSLRRSNICDNCKYCSYERGLWLCNHSANRG